jgi:hypothetical protein
VTQSEAELERVAAERGIRLSEWIREVLFRELRDSDQMNSGDHINYGKRLLTEIVGLQVFLTHVLSPTSGRVAGRSTIRANHAAGEGKETSLASRDFGGVITRYTNETNRDHSLHGMSLAEARSVSRLCDRSAADVVRP